MSMKSQSICAVTMFTAFFLMMSGSGCRVIEETGRLVLPDATVRCSDVPFLYSANARGLKRPFRLQYQARVDSNYHGGPLKSGGNEYVSGIGMDAWGLVVYDLGGMASGVRGKVGLDDSLPTDYAGSRFEIYLDRKLFFRTDNLMWGDKPKEFELAASGAKELMLVTTGGQGCIVNVIELEFSVADPERFGAHSRTVLAERDKYEGRWLNLPEAQRWDGGMRLDSLTEFAGVPNVIRLSNERINLYLAPELGGRIVGYMEIDDENLIYNTYLEEQRLSGDGSLDRLFGRIEYVRRAARHYNAVDEFNLFAARPSAFLQEGALDRIFWSGPNLGGSSVTVAPPVGKAFPVSPTQRISSCPCEVRVTGPGRVLFRGWPDYASGVRVDRQFTIFPGSTVVREEQILTNVSGGTLELGRWNVVTFRPRVAVIAPLTGENPEERLHYGNNYAATFFYARDGVLFGQNRLKIENERHRQPDRAVRVELRDTVTVGAFHENTMLVASCGERSDYPRESGRRAALFMAPDYSEVELIGPIRALGSRTGDNVAVTIQYLNITAGLESTEAGGIGRTMRKLLDEIREHERR